MIWLVRITVKPRFVSVRFGFWDGFCLGFGLRGSSCSSVCAVRFSTQSPPSLSHHPLLSIQHPLHPARQPKPGPLQAPPPSSSRRWPPIQSPPSIQHPPPPSKPLHPQLQPSISPSPFQPPSAPHPAPPHPAPRQPWQLGRGAGWRWVDGG